MTQNDHSDDQLALLNRIDAAIHAGLHDTEQPKDNSYGELRVLELRAQLISVNDGISLRDTIIRSQTDRIRSLVSERDSAIERLSQCTSAPSPEGASFDNMLRHYAAKSHRIVGRGLNALAGALRSIANQIRG